MTIKLYIVKVSRVSRRHLDSFELKMVEIYFLKPNNY